MLHDALWLAIAGEQDLLCMPCLRDRFRQRFDRDIAFSDLRPCLFNLNRCSAFEELAPADVRAWCNAFLAMYPPAFAEWLEEQEAERLHAAAPD
jgi:hypothetical protein